MNCNCQKKQKQKQKQKPSLAGLICEAQLLMEGFFFFFSHFLCIKFVLSIFFDDGISL